MPQPRSFAEGAEILRRLSSSQFPNLDGRTMARRRAARLANARRRHVPTYDVRLARTLTAIDLEQRLPPLWNEFDALAHVPMLVIRGANSDILSAETLAAMAARHPGMESIEVPDQGHVPLLEGEDIIGRLIQFVAACEQARTSPRPASSAARLGP